MKRSFLVPPTRKNQQQQHEFPLNHAYGLKEVTVVPQAPAKVIDKQKEQNQQSPQSPESKTDMILKREFGHDYKPQRQQSKKSRKEPGPLTQFVVKQEMNFWAREHQSQGGEKSSKKDSPSPPPQGGTSKL